MKDFQRSNSFSIAKLSQAKSPLVLHCILLKFDTIEVDVKLIASHRVCSRARSSNIDQVAHL